MNYSAIVIGGGHNGLTAAAYLAKFGRRVCVLERRPIIGGAAVTEEIITDFHFSRASYLLSLFRPCVINDLELKKYGLRYHIKNPTSFTPLRNSTNSLLLGSCPATNHKEISKFSVSDAKAYPKYEHMIQTLVNGLEPLMDREPLNVHEKKLMKRVRDLHYIYKNVRSIGVGNMSNFYNLMTSPISKILDGWFESDVLKATLATDGVIGFNASPKSTGTGYVLLHHVLGGLDGQSGAWAFVYGGMGSVSQCIAQCARDRGVDIITDTEVKEILVDNGKVRGVRLASGKEMYSDIVLSNATPKVTFLDLMDKSLLEREFRTAIESIDYTSPVTKINVALKSLPNFISIPNNADNSPMPHHQTTIHMNCESVEVVHNAYIDAQNGTWSKRPIIEMTIPSSVDDSIAPKGCHVALLFTQYTPYQLANGVAWSDEMKKRYAETVFSEIDAYAPNFSSSIVGYEVLTPPDLERIFGLTGGNIFHGSMTMDQLYWCRPIANYGNYRTPIAGLYLCGSGAHPGGGVTGAPGRLAALAVKADHR